MKLKSVHLENFRCFENVTVDFHEQLTVLVGTNGSGKSSLLDGINSFLFFLRSEKNKRINFRAIDKKITGKGNISFNYKMSLGNETYIIDSNSHANEFKENTYSSIVSAHYRSVRGVKKSSNFSSGVAGVGVVFNESLEWFADKEAEEAKHAKRIKNFDFFIPELEAVRLAIAQILGDYEKPYTDETPPEMFIRKRTEKDVGYRVSQLSDGYSATLALVMDLSRRMAEVFLEQNFADDIAPVLEMPGIVLIDEVDLHLHPSWQQRILPDLMRTFPNAQFIVTTHSPQVLSSVRPENIRILDGDTVIKPSHGTFGAEASRILGDVFGVQPRLEKLFMGSDKEDYQLKAKIDEYFSYIGEDKYDDKKVKLLRKELEGILGDDPLFARADAQIDRARRLKKRRDKHA